MDTYCNLGSEYLLRTSASGNIPTLYTIYIDSPLEGLNIYNWRASEASETLSGVYKFKPVRYIYIYMYGGTCSIIVAHAM